MKFPSSPYLTPSSPTSRREFLGRVAAAGAGLAFTAAATPLAHAAPTPTPATGANRRFKIAGFTKPFQYLNYDDTADLVAEVGWDGVELALRKGGHVLPERVDDDLPRLVEALKKRNLEVLTIATDIHNATDPLTEKVLRASARSGVKLYRVAHLQYDLSKPIPPQVANVRSGLRELLDLNKELGLTAAYENHSGKSSVGAPLWDLYEMLQGLGPEHYGVCFDIAHATVEGGLDWAVQFRLLEDYLRAIYVKDFLWTKKAAGWDADWRPLGEGMIDPAFFDRLKKTSFRGTVVQHHEYPLGRGPELLAALRRDRETLVKWLGEPV